jgi:cation:H+ antiporter
MQSWLLFLISSAVVVVAAYQLAKYGDVISVRTGLGGLLIGTIFLAGATSLPEFIASISSFRQGVPDLAAGNFFGSNMVNVMLLAIVDLVHYRIPLLRRVAITHTLTAALGITLMTVAVIFMLADIDIAIGWVGLDSLILIALYFGGVWLIQQEGKLDSGIVVGDAAVEPAPGFPSLRTGVIGFAASAAVLMGIVPLLVRASTDIANQTGLGTGFVGTALLSVITSLPELLAAFAAIRLGSTDLAIGNLFGSSVFNMLAVGVSDFFYLDGRFLGAIDPSFALVGLLAILLTNMALLANLARVERRLFFVEVDAIAIIVVYLLGMYLLFLRGMGG